MGASVLHRTVNGGICRLVSTACFASLNDDQRRELVALRSNNNGATLAAMLEATSLAVQPDLRANLSARTFAFYYLCGERDSKFRARRRNWLPTAMSFLAPDITRIGKIRWRNRKSGADLRF